MAKKVAQKTPAPEVKKPAEDIKEEIILTDRDKELRYYIQRLGITYGRDALKRVITFMINEMEELCEVT